MATFSKHYRVHEKMPKHLYLITGYSLKRCCSVDRRNVLKFLGGIGLGAITAETYEMLHHIPQLERRFMEEVNYWIDQYNSAKDAVDKLSNQLRQLEGEISNLRDEAHYWRAQFSSKSEEVGKLTLTVNKLDELERESTSSIAYYREKMEEAIKRLRETIEKYRAVLGDERVSFESTTLKVLEDLKLTQEKLLKLLPYFPLIRDLSWRPSRVVNDKIYDLEVYLEVISPLNTLAEVEVSLIPVEYDYFITRYGMRREDYPKVFPPEETKTIKLKPAGLERETFNVEFKDIIGGREYLIRVVAKDVADNAKSDERKTTYIREFENIGKQLYANGIIMSGVYMPWDMRGLAGYKLPDRPLLGLYDALDDVVQWKHIDWATGHGINVFWCSSNLNSQYEYEVAKNLLSKGGIFVGAMPGPDPWRMVRGGAGLPDWAYDLSDPYNRNVFIEIMTKWFSLVASPNYFRIEGKPAFFIWDENAFTNVNEAYGEMKKIAKNMGFALFVISHSLPRMPMVNINEQLEFWNRHKGKEWWNYIDALTSWIGFYEPSRSIKQIGIEERIEAYLNYYEKSITIWKNFCETRGKFFVPTITPGFDNSYSWGGPDVVPLPRSIERFRKSLEIAIKHTSLGYQEIRIDTWNDFGEWSYIEPSMSEKFNYLNTMKIMSRMLH
jgi:hypothetical protein